MKIIIHPNSDPSERTYISVAGREKIDPRELLNQLGYDDAINFETKE